jgi:hypothetical protein
MRTARWLVLGALAVSASACSSREIWVTPVSAPRISRGTSCPLAIQDRPEPGMQALAVVRCADGLFGKTCWELVREKACEAGGDVVFGAHYEGSDLVATIAASASEPVNGVPSTGAVVTATPH